MLNIFLISLKILNSNHNTIQKHPNLFFDLTIILVYIYGVILLLLTIFLFSKIIQYLFIISEATLFTKTQ